MIVAAAAALRPSDIGPTFEVLEQQSQWPNYTESVRKYWVRSYYRIEAHRIKLIPIPFWLYFLSCTLRGNEARNFSELKHVTWQSKYSRTAKRQTQQRWRGWYYNSIKQHRVWISVENSAHVPKNPLLKWVWSLDCPRFTVWFKPLW